MSWREHALRQDADRLARLVESERRRITEAEAGYRREIQRLEGLLDAFSSDPDRNLVGTQSHSLFRQVTAGGEPVQGTRDFPDVKRLDILRMSHMAYALRGDAEDLIETHLDYLLGDDGFAPSPVTRGDDKLQRLLDEVWKDERNQIDQNIEAMVRTLLLEGEYVAPAVLNDTDGSLEIGWVPSEDVTRVVQDRQGRDAFVLTRGPSGVDDERSHFVLNNLTDRIQISYANGPKGEKYVVTERSVDRAGFESVGHRLVHGLCFAWFINRPRGATRGRPELTAALDFIDAHDSATWTTVEREKLLNCFLIWAQGPDVNDEASAKKLLKQIGLSSPPTGPKVMATNKNVEISVMQPGVAAGSFEKLERILRLSIYAGKGLPEHWSGSGAESNLATAQAQESKPLKRLRRKQAHLVRCLTNMLRVQIDLRARAGSVKPVDHSTWRLNHTEVGGKDRQRGADVLQKVAAALSAAVSSSVIRREAANEIFERALQELGYEISKENAGVPEEEVLGPDDLLRHVAGADREDDSEPRGAGARSR